MKLYKYRSLKGCKQKGYVEDILRNHNFYLADRAELNDPMEGYFWSSPIFYQKYKTYDKYLEAIKYEKSKLRICSFSKKNDNILLWANYADGFKGIAIEITVDKKYKNLHRVTYDKHIPFINNLGSTEVKKDILSRKINIWSYEKEYRIIEETENKYFNYSKITGVYLGCLIQPEDEEYVKRLLYNSNINPCHTEVDMNNNKIKIK